MNFDVVETGSSGNFTVLENAIALDMGVSFKKVEPFLPYLKIVFVGHQHHDHFKEATIRKVARARPTLRFCGGPWMVEYFLKAGVDKRNIDVLDEGMQYDYGDFKIEPVGLFHNVPNYGLKIYLNGEKAFYAVDTGHMGDITAKGFDLYLLESNHTEAEIDAAVAEALEKGEFTYRTRAAENHLSYEQAVDWLTENMGPHSVWVPMHQHKDKERQDGVVRSTSDTGKAPENA